jgi:uncharacterized protein
MSRSPFVLNVSDLLGRDASSRTETVEASVDWGIELSKVKSEPPLSALLTLHPVSGGIAVTGSVEFVTKDSCYRCLESTLTERSATIGALFDRTDDDDDETYPLDGHDIDVEQMLRDEVLLSLPLSPSCGEDCKGLVSSAENDLNTEPSGDEGGSRSPFAVLKDLLEPED